VKNRASSVTQASARISADFWFRAIRYSKPTRFQSLQSPTDRFDRLLSAFRAMLPDGAQIHSSSIRRRTAPRPTTSSSTWRIKRRSSCSVTMVLRWLVMDAVGALSCRWYWRRVLTPVEHETEISFFVLKDYEAFKANPEEKW